MQPGANARAIRRAAVLLVHWSRQDLPAFAGCLAEVTSLDEAKDIIAAMAMTASLDSARLPDIILEAARREYAVLPGDHQ